MTDTIDHITHSDVTDAQLELFALSRWTQIAAKVLSYSSSPARATVRPIAKDQTRVIPDIPNIPVRFPSTKKNALTFPLEAGDPVVVHILTMPIDEYDETGADQVETQRGRRWRNSLSNSYCTPGLHAKCAPIPPEGFDPVALVVYAETLVKLGDATASDFVALSTPVDSNNALIDGAAAWAFLVEAAINILAPGTFTPANTLVGKLGASGATKVQAI